MHVIGTSQARHCLIWILLLLAAVPAATAEPAGPPPPGEATALEIAGRLTRADGSPLPGAEVELLAESDAVEVAASATTGADGSYRLPVPGAGLYRIRAGGAATPPFPVVESLRLPDGPEPMDAEDGDRAATARRGGAFREATGRVVAAETGAPLAGALVWPVGERGAVVTGADGRFSLEAPARAGAALTAVAAGRVQVRRGLPEEGEAIEIALARGLSASGKVVDPEGRPIPGARVALTGSTNRAGDVRTVTGSAPDGGFRVCCAAPGEALTVTAERPGYGSSRLARDATDAGPWQDVRAILATARDAFGYVLGPDGEPIPGARARLVPETGGAPAAGGGHEAESGADGRFDFAGVRFLRHRLLVQHPDWPPARLPGLDVPPDGEPLALGTLHLAPGAAISGEVVDDLGVPLPGARVRAVPSEHVPGEPTRIVEARSGPDGRFRLAALERAGTVDIEVSAPDRASAVVAAVPVPPAEPLRITLARGGEIGGRVVDEDGAPVAGVALRASVRRDGRATPPRTAASDANGVFVLGGLGGGEVTLEVERTPFLPRRLTIELEAGEVQGDLEIELSRGASIAGSVVDPEGAPVAHASVSGLLPAGPDAALQRRSAETGDDGRFRLTGLPSGRWTLAVRAPGFPRRIEDVEVGGSDAPVAAEIRLERGALLSGRVLDEAGEAVAGATVSLALEARRASRHPMLAPEPLPEAVTGPSGSFRLAGVPPGDYRLVAASSRHATSRDERTLRVDEAPIDGLLIYLEAAGTVAGRVGGVGLEELGRLEVAALRPSDGTVVIGRVGPDGGYRVGGLGVGAWTLTASVADTGIGTAVPFVIDAPGRTVRLELRLHRSSEERPQP